MFNNLKIKAMKKVIVISIMSLIFLATYAQRPSKSRSTEVNDIDRKKSEKTTERSANNTSRTVEMKSDRSGNDNDHSTYTPRNTENRSDNTNYNRTSTPGSMEDRPEKVYNNRTITPRDDNPDENINRNADERNRNISDGPEIEQNRTIEDKINYNKTEIHRNIEPARPDNTANHTGYYANDGRNRGISSRTYEVERRNYNTPDRVRDHHEVHGVYRPSTVEYRRIHHPYRVPVHINVVWTPRMYYDYRMIYPEYEYWYYPYGYRIRTISAYDALYYTGEIVNVYGRVTEAWYSWKTDEYILYFGARYPYQDFSVIIPGHRARQFSHRPEIFFEGRYIWVTGLISLHNGQPEMVLMKKHQIHIY
jgi:hypothetical protein